MITNNDIIRRLRYTFDFGDDKMIALFAMADFDTNRAEVSNWLKKDEHEEFLEMDDSTLASFLNGFINDRRGKKEGPQPTPETHLTNNDILKKIKIALNLKAEELLAVFSIVNKKITKSEMNAMLRKPTHAKYIDCQDQYLRQFMHGLQLHFRPNAPVEESPKKS